MLRKANDKMATIKNITENSTLENFINYYLENIVKNNCAETTYKSYKTKMNKYVVPLIGMNQLGHLKRTNITNLIDYLCYQRTGLSSNSVRQIYRILHKILDFAVEIDVIDKNISNHVKLPPQEKYKPKIYNASEIEILLQKAEDSFLYVPIYIAVKTGLRRSEILALRWKDIDLNNRLITVGSIDLNRPKSRNSIRTIKFPESLLGVLTNHKSVQQKDFSKNNIEQTNETLAVCKAVGSPINPTFLSRKFTKFLVENNLPLIHFHSLRHSFATLAHNNGMPIKYLSKILGHANPATTLDYYVTIDELSTEFIND